MQNYMEYRRFVNDQYVAIGRKVEVDGYNGIIKEIKLTHVVIRGKDSRYLIQMNRWRYCKWIFMDEYLEKKNERKNGENL